MKIQFTDKAMRDLANEVAKRVSSAANPEFAELRSRYRDKAVNETRHALKTLIGRHGLDLDQSVLDALTERLSRGEEVVFKA